MTFAALAATRLLELVRAERRLGVPWRVAAAQAFARALWPVLDGLLAITLIALALGPLGAGRLQGFASTLVIGTATTMASLLMLAPWWPTKRAVATPR